MNYKIHFTQAPDILQCGLNLHGMTKEDVFQLEQAWSLHFVQYEGRFTVGDHTVSLRPGSLTLAPPNTRLKWQYHQIDAAHYYIHFKTFPLEGDDKDAIHAPLLTDPEPELQSTLLEAFELIIHTHSSAPHLAKARLWWLLFELFQSDSKPNPKPTHANLPPVLQTVVAIIDHELHTHLPLRALTARVGISHAQLYRLFQSYFHCSPSRYLQQKRREKAEELLLNSSMEIKQIATLVGFSDAQQFNKWCKKQLGASPRKVRNSNLESPLAE